ncbi:SusD/RagB family nutrient-binding outer membrane lipoprotein [Robiginitalea sp. IMCC43444]|uniref:SusD/RagB family nutrient-binding outer membrane lipoprotein n=1 Tax=Robiginitalea sp. IMCC43444 TaxID=3459121 RepID=UPI004041E9FE
MKKRIFILLIVFLGTSCVSDEQYEAYNENPKQPIEVSPELLFNFALKTLSDQMAASNININVFRFLSQYWTATTYPDETNFVFNNRRIPQNHWSRLYRDVLLDLDSAGNFLVEDSNLSEPEKASRLAQIEVLAVYCWQVLVDTFGDIPYSQALNTVAYPLPAYDDAATIYEDLIARIDTAIPNLSGTGFETDNLYFGDLQAWQKFAASLKLRLGIRLADVNPALASATVESAFATGVFTSNNDNASFAYLGISNPNPVWTDIVQSGRKDFVVANTIVDIMNTLNDPRRSIYFADNLGPDIYEGGIYGANNTYENYTHIGPALLEPTTPASLLDFAEVSFYLAEASARGINVGGTPEEYYNQAITASFDYWGVPDIATYLAQPEVAYSTASGDWREKIGLQFWLAMYNRGFEGWTAWRTFDTPVLNLPAITGNPIPTRYTYPINEQNLNEQNWLNASEAIGGDTQTTRLFWDTQ